MRILWNLKLGNIPILAFFDYAAAFPSVAHAWLLAVLQHSSVPRGFFNAIKTLYSGTKGFCNIGGISQFVFMVLSGVLQGCPLSGTLLVIAMDPIMFCFPNTYANLVMGRSEHVQMMWAVPYII